MGISEPSTVGITKLDVFFFQMERLSHPFKKEIGMIFLNKVDKMTRLTPPGLDLLRSCIGQMIFVLNFAGADWIFYPPGTVELIGGLPKHPRSSGGATDFFLEK